MGTQAGTPSPKAVDAMSRTLFEAPVPLVTGSVVLCVASALVAHRLGGIAPVAAALAFAIIGFVRVGILVAYVFSPTSMRDHASMPTWRGAYAAGTLASSLTLGLLTAYCLVASDDLVSHVILVATAVGYGSGVAGRNAACPEASLPQLWAVLLPAGAALMAHGDIPYAVLGGTVLVFGHGMTHISRSIHASIAGAYRSAQDREVFAERLADALGTMHHGFCLFDAEGKVVTGSASLGTLLRIPVPAPGTTPAGIASACEANGTRARGAARLASVLGNLAVTKAGTTRDIPLEDGRTISFTATPKAGGGCVLVLEDVTERVAAEARLVRMARHDSLTGLLNRAAAAETLDGCIGRNEPVAIHLIDLDRFKGVNDSFGHSVGDGLLRAVASRITAILPEGSHAARLGGDEFLVLQVGHVPEAPSLAAAISAAIDAPYEVDGRELSISASIGYSVFPRDGDEGGTLMRNADTALYQVKTGGRHGWRAFDAGMDEAARERREMEGDLREAVATRAFEVVYQPQMDLATGGTTTYEALVRWDRPGRGPVSPADFIPLAEETGLIHAIGRIVLEMACREATGWQEGTRIAVNISPAQFRNDIPGTVAQVLAATGLPPRRLELEVTESVFLESQDDVLAAFRRLSGMGVRISLDDFGTGYSSLGYLRAFPFDKVKVDRSFVGDIEAKGESRAIVRAVIGLGADLGMQVVAEGVETDGQLSALRDLRCDTVQGYLISRPLRAADVPARAKVQAAA